MSYLLKRKIIKQSSFKCQVYLIVLLSQKYCFGVLHSLQNCKLNCQIMNFGRKFAIVVCYTKTEQILSCPWCTSKLCFNNIHRHENYFIKA